MMTTTTTTTMMIVYTVGVDRGRDCRADSARTDRFDRVQVCTQPTRTQQT